MDAMGVVRLGADCLVAETAVDYPGLHRPEPAVG